MGAFRQELLDGFFALLDRGDQGLEGQDLAPFGQKGLVSSISGATISSAPGLRGLKAVKKAMRAAFIFLAFP